MSDVFCEAVNALGIRCGGIALVNSIWCASHFKYQNQLKPTNCRHDGSSKHATMGVKFYSKRLGPKLYEYVEQFCATARQEQLDIQEEIAIVRDMAGEAVEMWQKTLCLKVGDNVGEVTQSQKDDFIVTTRNMARDAMCHVTKLCETAAKIDAAAADKFSVRYLRDFADQMTRIVHDVFDNDVEGMLRFDQELSNRLQLPSIGDNIMGSNISIADRDVRAMDSAIPSAPDS